MFYHEVKHGDMTMLFKIQISKPMPGLWIEHHLKRFARPLKLEGKLESVLHMHVLIHRAVD